MTKMLIGSQDSNDENRYKKRNDKIREKYDEYKSRKTPKGKQELTHERIMDYMMEEDIVGALSREWVEKIVWKTNK